jgi:hypothetical protein
MSWICPKCETKNTDKDTDICEVCNYSNSPQIITWTSDSYEAIIDEVITISWELINAKKCSISNIGDVPEKGTRQIRLSKDMSIKLEFTSHNKVKYESEPIDIKVYPSPKIKEFFIFQKEIIKDTPIKITWFTKNAIEVFLSINGVQTSVDTIDTMEIRPVIDTEVELIVIGNLNKELRKTEKILVHEPAKILSFNVNQFEFLDNDTIIFHYNVVNVSKVYISGSSIANKQDVTNSTEFDVIASSQNSIQTYFLEVIDEVNNSLPPQTITVNVYPQPSIITFSTSKDKILIGDEIDLRWDVSHYSKITLVIEGQSIDVTNITSYKLKPSNPVNYKLVVTSLANLKQIESQLIVQVLQHVELDISANRSHTVQTVPVTLNWNVKNATEVFLRSRTNELNSKYGNKVDIVNKKYMEVIPERTTFYKITAKNELDEVEKEIFINVFELPKITSISLPELPPLALYFPSLNFTDETYKPKLRKSMEDNKWYYNLFAWQMKSISQELYLLFDNFNKKFYNILKIKENES